MPLLQPQLGSNLHLCAEGPFASGLGALGDAGKESNRWQDDASTTASCLGMSFASRSLLSSDDFGLIKKKKNVYLSNLIEASFPFGKSQKWVL